jgi:hypothetical protein
MATLFASHSDPFGTRPWQVWPLVGLLLFVAIEGSSAVSTTVPPSLDKRQQRTPHADAILGYRRGPENICTLTGFFNIHPLGKSEYEKMRLTTLSRVFDLQSPRFFAPDSTRPE